MPGSKKCSRSTSTASTAGACARIVARGSTRATPLPAELGFLPDPWRVQVEVNELLAAEYLDQLDIDGKAGSRLRRRASAAARAGQALRAEAGDHGAAVVPGQAADPLEHRLGQGQPLLAQD